MPEIVNVKEYGAAGNGMTDDYYAIQSAIQAINHRGGGIMFFPPGVYRINQYKILGTTKTGLLPNGISSRSLNVGIKTSLYHFTMYDLTLLAALSISSSVSFKSS
jgi:hypothetical protein